MAATVLLDNVSSNAIGQPLDCTGKRKALLRVTGNFDAAVVFEASIDGTDYFSYSGKPNGADSFAAVLAAPGYMVFDVGPIMYLRPKVTRYKSGRITVVGYAE